MPNDLVYGFFNSSTANRFTRFLPSLVINHLMLMFVQIGQQFLPFLAIAWDDLVSEVANRCLGVSPLQVRQ